MGLDIKRDFMSADADELEVEIFNSDESSDESVTRELEENQVVKKDVTQCISLPLSLEDEKVRN